MDRRAAGGGLSGHGAGGGAGVGIGRARGRRPPVVAGEAAEAGGAGGGAPRHPAAGREHETALTPGSRTTSGATPCPRAAAAGSSPVQPCPGRRGPRRRPRPWPPAPPRRGGRRAPDLGATVRRGRRGARRRPAAGHHRRGLGRSSGGARRGSTARRSGVSSPKRPASGYRRARRPGRRAVGVQRRGAPVSTACRPGRRTDTPRKGRLRWPASSGSGAGQGPPAPAPIRGIRRVGFAGGHRAREPPTASLPRGAVAPLPVAGRGEGTPIRAAKAACVGPVLRRTRRT